MKRLALMLLLAGVFGATWGCSTPAYSAQERSGMIWRNWCYEGGMMVDDFDTTLMLRPSSRLTIWAVR